jgi:hypothetical protein
VSACVVHTRSATCACVIALLDISCDPSRFAGCMHQMRAPCALSMHSMTCFVCLLQSFCDRVQAVPCKRKRSRCRSMEQELTDHRRAVITCMSCVSICTRAQAK